MPTSITYNSTTGYEEAKRRIEECIKSKASYLDLGALSLLSIPPSLEKCIYIKELNLGHKIRWNTSQSNWVEIQDFQFKPNKNRIKEIPSSIGALTNLSLLNLNSNQISEIKNLDKLIGLNILDLSSNQISEIKNLDQLTSLTLLNLRFNKIKEIKNLDQLTTLIALNLGSNKIEELKNLDQLTSLKELRLSDNKIKELKNLDQLSNLTYLDLWNNQISKIKNLDQLSNLIELDLSSNQIQALKNLDKFPSLRMLHLWDNKIEELNNLNQTTSLNSLDLRYNSLKLDTLKPILDSPINQFALSSTVKDIPYELTKSDIFDELKDANCLDTARIWYNELEKGKTNNHLFKLVVLGNGNVGKTQIINRLLGRPFKEKTESTHGIRMEISPSLILTEGAAPINLHIWDFGGQEIYHQTHRLFLDYRAIYIIVFDAETYHSHTQEDPKSKEEEPSRALSFWLNEILSRDNDSPIIVVQNKMDDETAEIININSDLPKYLWLEEPPILLSALNDRNLVDLKKAIQRKIEETQEFKMQIPISWAIAREQSIALNRVANPKIHISEFIDQICINNGIIGGRHFQAILKYFHSTGLLFYDPRFFKKEIILNQQWALNAIYQVLRRNPSKGSEEYKFWDRCQFTKGQFKAYDLPIDHNVYSEEDRQLFLNFMESAGILFQIETDSDEPVYQMMRGLPTSPSKKIREDWNNVEGKLLHYQYFHQYHLHAGIIEQFIIQMAKHCNLNQLWQNGSFVEWNSSKAWVNVDYKSKFIQISVAGREKEYLLNAIQNKFSQIQGENKTILELASNDFKNWVLISKLEEAREFEAKFAPLFGKEKEKIEWKELSWALKKNPDANFYKKPIIIHQIIGKAKDLHITNLKEQIESFTMDGHLSQALSLIIEHYQGLDGKQLKQQLSRLKKDQRLGLVSRQDANVELNFISFQILQLASELDEAITIKKSGIIDQFNQELEEQLDRIEEKAGK